MPVHVNLDGKPCEVNAATVGAAIALAADLARANQRTIVEVSVDGVVWQQSDFESPERLNAVGGEVHLATADAVELICQTFHDAATALGDADQLQRDAAYLLQSDQLVAALEKLNEAFSIWINVQQAVTMGSSLGGINLNDEAIVSTGGVQLPPINERIDRLNSQLRTVRTALEAKDTVALSDTLLYDLPDVVQEWRVMLDDLRAHIRSRQ